MTKNLNSITKKHNLSYYNLLDGRKIKLNSTLFDNSWKMKMIKEILHMRDSAFFDGLNLDEMDFFDKL